MISVQVHKGEVRYLIILLYWEEHTLSSACGSRIESASHALPPMTSDSRFSKYTESKVVIRMPQPP